ncbi:MAG: serine/threonine protein kinase [Rhodobacteraceae bacterium PARR1]|nr:MAG: serine/threonine protein kinase [Rhodobacteraceae bacterium PARR1]
MDLPLPNGTKLAGFTIIDEIARGGFGITYRATASNGAVVALKEYFPAELAQRAGDLAVQPQPDQRRLYFEGLRAFLSEANTLKSLPQRVGLVQVRAAFEKFGTAYCAMDYIEGEPLSRLVPRVQQRHGHIPENLLRDLIGPICLALEAVHSCRLVHRDVKPANVMLRLSDQTPVLIDFGAARPTGQKASSLSMITQRYAPIELFPAGTPGLPSGLAEGPWSDIYSFCVMIYEMMTQETPPNAKTRIAQVQKHQPDPLLPLAEALARLNLSDRYSPALVAAVESGCALMPDKRPRSARDLAQMIGIDLVEPRPRGPAGVQAPPPVQDGVKDAGKDTGKDTGVFSTVAMALLILGIAAAVVALSTYNAVGG